MSYYKLGVVCGILLGLLVVAVIALVSRSAGKSTGPLFSFNFDERQKVARGQAFQWAFITLAAYLLLCPLAEELLGGPWADSLTTNTLGILLSLSVFAVLCVLRDAYFSISEKPKTVLFFVGGVTLLNGGISLFHLLTGGYVENGLLRFTVLNPACTVLLLSVLIACAVKRSRDEKEAAE